MLQRQPDHAHRHTTLAVQEALEQLEGERSEEEPHLIHDHGSQFSAEWKAAVTAVKSDTSGRRWRTRRHRKLERLHRKHREEGFAGAASEDYSAGLAALAR